MKTGMSRRMVTRVGLSRVDSFFVLFLNIVESTTYIPFLLPLTPYNLPCPHPPPHASTTLLSVWEWTVLIWSLTCERMPGMSRFGEAWSRQGRQNVNCFGLFISDLLAHGSTKIRIFSFTVDTMKKFLIKVLSLGQWPPQARYTK